jgi:hypothetical protein
MEKHMLINKKIIVLLLFIIAGCQIDKIYKRRAYNTDILFLLKKDHSFINKQSINAETDTFFGTWKIIEDTLITNIISPKVFFSEDSTARVLELHERNKDSVYFKVYVDNSDSFVIAHIFLNNNFSREAEVVSDTSGFSVIKSKSINSFIACPFLQMTDITHYIKDTSANYFKIYTHSKPLPENNLRINPTLKYIIKWNKLLPFNYDNQVRKDYYLKRKFLTFSATE